MQESAKYSTIKNISPNFFHKNQPKLVFVFLHQSQLKNAKLNKLNQKCEVFRMMLAAVVVNLFHQQILPKTKQRTSEQN